MAATGRPDNNSLVETIKSTLDLLKRFNSALLNVSESPTSNLTADSPEPLAVLNTSAILLKAHATKLSLLILNKPFTPSAIRKIIIDVSSTCLPAMMSAVEMSRAKDSILLLQVEVTTRVQRTFTAVEYLLGEILSQNDSVEGQNEGSSANPSRDTLSSTGVLWESCDALIELHDIGVVEIVIRMVQEYRETIEDARAELKGWSEDVADEEEDIDGKVASSDEQDSMEDLFEAANRLPKDREDLSTLITQSLKQLKLISTLYQALIKRRLKTIPVSIFTRNDDQNDTAIQRRKSLDMLLRILMSIPETVDDLANAFYELDAEDAQRLLDKSRQKGIDAITLVDKTWNGDDDAFTTWSAKWVEGINGHSS